MTRLDAVDAIVTEDLHKRYKTVQALDGVSFSVREGEVFGLLGPNGAGKSTSVRVLTTLTKPDSGRALVAGEDVVRHPNRVRHMIGYVAQDSGVDWEATGRENLLLQGRIHAMAGAELHKRVDELLGLLGLVDAADRVARGYSGGMKRRLDIALGLVHKPRVLFLDEPTTGLDPEARAAMWVEVERLAVQENLTILLTTHYLEEADRLAERVAIVSRGKIVVEGTPEELKAGLHGESVTVELDDTDTRAHEAAAVVRAVDGDERGHGRGAPSPGARPERRPGDPRDPLDAREPRLPGRRGHDRPAVARRRLPPLHRPRVQGRGRGGQVVVQTVRQTGWMVVRQGRNLMREPIWIAMMIIQPLLWLLLYGQLFSKVTPLHGGASSYIEFLTPGIICMNAFFGGSWSGMAMISDLDRHVIDRFLAAPASRLAIILSQVVRAGVTAIIQAIILLAIGYLLGVRVHGGVLGVLVVFAAAFLLASVFAGFSHGIALLLRREASMIATANFVSLPLMFLSSILIGAALMPGWIRQVSRFNPVNWGVQAARNAVVFDGPWGQTAVYLLLLLAATAATSAFATWSFRAYQRSI